MGQRLQHSLAIMSVAACVLAGVAGLPVWSSIIGGLCLTLIALWDHEKLRQRFSAVGATHMLAMANLAGVLDGFLVSFAAWCLGAAFRFVLQSV